MAYSVPDLPYDYDALEPHIDEATMRVHHDKHHQAYVDKANAALEGTEWADKDVEEVLRNLDSLPEDKRTPVRNNGGGHYNHTLFWESMSPDGGGEPSGALGDAIAGTDLDGKPVEEALQNLSSLPDDKQTAFRNNGGGHANHTLFWESMSPDGGGEPSGDLGDAIKEAFGSFDDFKEQFEANGVGQFGSGWTWLVLDGGELKLTKTPNQDSPVLDGQTPLLGNDVWEHAYYLKYQNKRPDYLKAWWNVVNWDKVAERYDAA